VIEGKLKVCRHTGEQKTGCHTAREPACAGRLSAQHGRQDEQRHRRQKQKGRKGKNKPIVVQTRC